jgi:hypothetical protein
MAYGYALFASRGSNFQAFCRRLSLSPQVFSGSPWNVIDAYGMTVGRPEFRGQFALENANLTCGVSYAITNLALNIACAA